VTLGNDVWIGHGAILLPGVEIGTGAVVGAGAVVTKNVRPFTIVAGVPAKALRRRLQPELEEAYMRIRWWDWPHERLAEAMEDFRKLNAEEFAVKYDPEKERAAHEAYWENMFHSL
jgi:carbonic anhydrase/acetyltransferase-like protein (isoleucine patch superfamily)